MVSWVGVDVNTASPSLLEHIPGLSKSRSSKIVKFRDEHGRLASRQQLQTIDGIGTSTFEQCAGFLRVYGGDDVLDETSVHPESYGIAQRVLECFDISPDNDFATALNNHDFFLTAQDSDDFYESKAAEWGCDALTLRDVVRFLRTRGVDPRVSLPQPRLSTRFLSLDELRVDMEMEGVVTNCTDFGLFLDIGVKEPCLLNSRYLNDFEAEVDIGDVLRVAIKTIRREPGAVSVAPVHVVEQL